MFDDTPMSSFSGNDPPGSLFVPEALPGRPPADRHLLFFALIPPHPVTALASLIAEESRQRHGLVESAMPAARQHLTLQALALFGSCLPREVISAAIDAAAGLVAFSRPVPIRFDCLGSMGPRPPTVLALHADDTSRQALTRVRNPLVRNLKRNGLDVKKHDAPHISLVYGTSVVAKEWIEPISWTATELVLLVSHQGRAHHEVVARWPLGGGH